MQSFVAFSLLASATLVSAAFDYPEAVPVLERRQEPGTPRYACHENCGTLITLAREEPNYCDLDEYNDRFAKCMVCAYVEDVWKYYGGSVSAGAEECGLDPSPVPVGGDDDETTTTTTAAAEITTTTSVADDVTTTVADEEITTTVADEETTTSAAADEETSTTSDITATETATTTQADDEATETDSATTITTGFATSSSAGSLGTVGTNPGPSPTSVPISGASKYSVGGALVFAVVAAINMI